MKIRIAGQVIDVAEDGSAPVPMSDDMKMAMEDFKQRMQEFFRAEIDYRTARYETERIKRLKDAAVAKCDAIKMDIMLLVWNAVVDRQDWIGDGFQMTIEPEKGEVFITRGPYVDDKTGLIPPHPNEV